ncbi:MAG: copper homeostasis protein CutC [Bacteroidetes bacterium]|nr:copper homeostasis protein CutC [Bacteroidota bacterium]MDA1120277.1 copper homeostasis protein CutC [Bacteroidota bacterium]
MILEVCAYDIEWAVKAQKAGADRIELCSGFAEGGLTPGYGTIQKSRKLLDIDLFIMIRPRDGDFLYSAKEFEIMADDIAIAKELGADGVVFGMLKKDGSIDIRRMSSLVRLAKPMEVTFHRAFDMADKPFKALIDIIETGCDRILTSGQRAKAFDGIELLRELNDRAGDEISIMAGSGVNSSNIDDIVTKTGLREVHMSGHTLIPSGMIYRKKGLTMGSASSDEFGIHSINSEEIAKVKQILENLS